jgi:hypothetical protein
LVNKNNDSRSARHEPTNVGSLSGAGVDGGDRDEEGAEAAAAAEETKSCSDE